MVFEQKKKFDQETDEEVKSYFWTFLKWYWLVIPTIYFLFGLPGILESTEGSSLSLIDISTLFFQILNFVMAGNMFLIDPLERSRTGVADKFLKIGVIQQFFTENIFGIILILLTWYQLPKALPADFEEEEEEVKHLKPRTNLIIAIISTVLSFALFIARIILI